MMLKIPAGSAKCSKESSETTISAGSFAEVTNTQVLGTPAVSAFLPGCLQNVFAHIDADHPLGAILRHLYGVSFPAPKVNHRLSGNLSVEIFPEKGRPLRLSLITAPAIAIWTAGTNPFQ